MEKITRSELKRLSGLREDFLNRRLKRLNIKPDTDGLFIMSQCQELLEGVITHKPDRFMILDSLINLSSLNDAELNLYQIIP